MDNPYEILGIPEVLQKKILKKHTKNYHQNYIPIKGVMIFYLIK